MNRLLFAAAREARIERTDDGKPREVRLVAVLPEYGIAYRIRREDEQLQYGPISSALREFARTKKFPDTMVGMMAKYAYVHEVNLAMYFSKDIGSDPQIFALFLAETFADTGM